jgi:hypothetical protein
MVIPRQLLLVVLAVVAVDTPIHQVLLERLIKVLLVLAELVKPLLAAVVVLLERVAP